MFQGLKKAWSEPRLPAPQAAERNCPSPVETARKRRTEFETARAAPCYYHDYLCLDQLLSAQRLRSELMREGAPSGGAVPAADGPPPELPPEHPPVSPGSAARHAADSTRFGGATATCKYLFP